MGLQPWTSASHFHKQACPLACLLGDSLSHQVDNMKRHTMHLHFCSLSILPPISQKRKPRFLRPSSFTDTRKSLLNKLFWAHSFRFTLIKSRKFVEDKEKRGKASNEASQVGLGAPAWHTASHCGSVCTLLWGFLW